jgi:hypothetical protein
LLREKMSRFVSFSVLLDSQAAECIQFNFSCCTVRREEQKKKRYCN